MTRLRPTRPVLPGVAIAALLPLLGGCNQDLLDQNTALADQNRELQDQLSLTRSALDAAEADRNAMLARMNQLELQATTAGPIEFTPAANTGFDAIPGVTTTQTGGQIAVRVPGDVLFAPGKVDLKSSSKDTLDQIASVLNADYPGDLVRVEGYTDTDPIKKSKWKDNLHLSMERAAAVERYLHTKGVEDAQVYSAGFGETVPLGSKAQSRRVEIVVVLDGS